MLFEYKMLSFTNAPDYSILKSQFGKEFNAVFEGFEGMFFRNNGRDDIEGAKHVHGLRLDDGH